MASHIGPAIDRVDGRDKVTGRARYAVEHPLANTAHAVLIVSTIAKGRVAAMDTSLAMRAPGVLAVMTPMNAPKLPPPKGESERPAKRVLTLLQDDRVRYANQPIGVVVAETLEAATEAAALVRVRYESEPHEVRMEPHLATAYTPREAGRPDQPAEQRRGDVERGLSEADVRVEHVYTTPFETHNPMEPHATSAVWEGARTLTLYDATQGVFGCRARVAELLGLDPADVRVRSPYLGGGFGSKGPTWSHVVLAAMAARQVQRPVKLALTRPQMFGPIGHRSQTRQSIVLGARRDGTLSALRHDTVAHTSAFDEFMEAAGTAAAMLYAVPNCEISHKLVRSDIGTPSYTRAPGWAPGTYALECAMDEMAVALEMDPLAFRLKNYAEQDPDKGRPWSLKSLRECYRIGAERFGWSRRPMRAGTLREGRERIGWGMATSVYPTHRSAAGALARLQPDGTVLVLSGTQDIGTGTYTILTQVAAETLGVPASRVVFRLGDTDFPQTPVSGGSQTAASAGSAVHAAATALREKLIQTAIGDSRSALAGLAASDVTLDNGRLVATRDPSRGETLQALAGRQASGAIEARGESKPGDEEKRFGMYAFGAQFVEVRVDADLGQVRVSRMVGAFDAGRVLNAKTARNQMAGGMIWGLAMATHEDTRYDPGLGRIVNNNLAEYHVPVNADVPAIDVTFVDAIDPHANPIGVKGIGELGITGAPAAIANAIYHATGKRVRDLPIRLDRLL
jgi:xanthine dehydrogenase YagR molybdenum-binding subunit